MTCREVDEILIGAAPGQQLPSRAREHAESCGKCRALMLAGDGGAGPAITTQLIERVQGTVLPSLWPVRPLAGAGLFAGAFLLIFAAFATGGAAWLGVRGLSQMTRPERIGVFGALLGLAVLAATATARGMRPAVRTITGVAVASAAIAVIEPVFLLLFHDYDTRGFVPAGLDCLEAGLVCAIPAGIVMLSMVRRGFVVAHVSTGLAAGTLAGLTGLTMLELHCPNLTVPHVAIWHAAVLVVSSAAGAGAGWLRSQSNNRSLVLPRSRAGES